MNVKAMENPIPPPFECVQSELRRFPDTIQRLSSRCIDPVLAPILSPVVIARYVRAFGSGFMRQSATTPEST